MEKVHLETDIGKTVEKYTVSGRKSKPPNSKNVAKTMEGCSKSHFPHFRTEVEKRPSDTSFSRGFGKENRSRSTKNCFQKCGQKINEILTYFFSLLAPIWVPTATLKIKAIFSFPRHLGARRVAKVLQDVAQTPFYPDFLGFGARLSRIF